MNETSFREVIIKSIAIIGFFATIVIIVWLTAEGIKKAPAAISSLASIAETVSNYRAIHELNVTSDKTVVNSDEPFQIAWTNVHQTGEYHFSYTCTQGIDLSLRDVEGTVTPFSCTDTLSLPATVHELTLSVASEDMRFTDIPLKVSFTNNAKTETLEHETKITVVNAAIPATEVAVAPTVETPALPSVPETPVEPAKPIAEPVTPEVVAKPVVAPVVTEVTVVTKPEVVTKPVVAVAPTIPKPKPVLTVMYPQSDPNGYSDLAVTALGSGVLKNDVFMYTAKYDRDLRNSIKFDIRNIGTKTSEVWSFRTILPDGTIYQSNAETGLKPNEHVEFTLGFNIDDEVTSDFVKVVNTVYTTKDTNASNNSSVWHVAVQK